MLLAGIPDPTSPGTPAVFSIAIGFAATSYGLWRRLPRDEVQWMAFLAAYAGAGLGLITYIVALLVQLY